MSLSKKIFHAAVATAIASPFAAVAFLASADDISSDLACRFNADGGAETYSKQSGEIIYRHGDHVTQDSDTRYGTAFRVGALDIEAPPQLTLTANARTRECYFGEGADIGIPLTGPGL